MPTAWGEIEMSVAATGASDAMGTPLVSLGYIKEDSLAIETEDGEMMQLFGTGHVLVDEQGSEPSLRVKGTLLGIAQAKQFWDMGEAPNTGRVESFVTTGNYSVKFASKVVGSDTFEAPKCKIAAKPLFSEKEGWTVELTITVLKGQGGYFFNFGTVAGS